MSANNFNVKGLTDEQVIAARVKYGKNQLAYKKENGFDRVNFKQFRVKNIMQ